MCLDRGTVGAKVCTRTFLQTVPEIAIVLFLIADCAGDLLVTGPGLTVRKTNSFC